MWLLVAHDKSLFSLFMTGLQRPDFMPIDQLFCQAMFRTLYLFDFD